MASRAKVAAPPRRLTGTGGPAPRPRPLATLPARRGRAAASFPLRLACIDMGSNATRFLAAEFTGPRQSAVLASDRVPLRLGHGVFLTGRLLPQAIDHAIEALTGFRARMDALGITHYRAVATSAVRESRNGDRLLQRARREAGIELEVIGGSEEARLVHLAVSARIPLGTERWVLADLGGGSVEVMLADGSGVFWSESQTMGSVRLLEELAEAHQRPGAFQKLLAEYVSTLKVPRAALQPPPTGFIGTGGNIEALAQLAGSNRAKPRAEVAVLTLAQLRALIRTLSRLSYRQRVEELGLREDRADVILPAAMVFERLCSAAGARRMLVPQVGVKDGVLLDLVDRLTARGDREDRQEKRIREAALEFGRRFFFDEPHAVQVCRLSVELFDQLRAMHRLGDEDRRILLVAALLHDVGSYISLKRHQRHSHYLIAQSELPELTAEQTQLAATVARFHRKGVPGSKNLPPGQDPDRVSRLAALLRIADALDREHRTRVREAHATVHGNSLRLLVRGQGDLLLERWAMRRKSELFENTFGLRLRVKWEKARAA